MYFSLTRVATKATALATGALLLTSGLAMSSVSAIPARPCAVGIAPVGGCTLASGATITFILKGGNGGAGGAGGNAEGGGAGGLGGAGGAGAKWEQGYTNSNGGTVTIGFTLGANGAAGAAGTAGTGGNGGSAGGGGNGGGDTIIDVGSSTIAIALGGDGGNGGNGGGPSAGTNGTAGADAPAGNLSTTNSEAPFIQITAISYPTAPTTTTVTVTFNASGGSCTVTSVSGAAGTWAATPRANNCTLAGSTLSGWQARQGGNPFGPVFLPGTSINLSSDNTLYALWTTGNGGGTAAPTPGAGVPARVIWSFQKGKTVVRVGSPKAMVGRSPFVTLSTKTTSSVTAEMISQAKAVAKEYDGIYGGVVRADTWNKPRIVAVYTS